MSAGSNCRLFLFKIKSQVVSHTALTLKHCWHRNTLIYEGVTKGHGIKKKSKPLLAAQSQESFQTFFMTYHTFSTQRKRQEKKFPCRKSLSLF